MRQHISRLSKDSLFYGFGIGLGQLFSFILAPILTAIFSPSEYGMMSLLQTTFGFMIVIALINLSSGVYFYYFDNDDSNDKKIIISTSIFFHVTIALFFSVVVWSFASYFSDILNIHKIDSKNIDYTKYIKILAVGLFFSIIETQFKSLLRMLRRPKLFVILTVIQLSVNFSAVILLVVINGLGIEGAFYAAIIASIVTVAIGFFMLKDEYVKSFSFAYLGLFFSYALPQFPSVFFNWGLSQSNNFFLNYFSTLHELGMYSIAFKIASIFLLFATAFRMAWDPFSLSIMKQADAKEIYKKIYNYFMIAFIWISSCLAFYGKAILILITPEIYHSSYLLIGILSFAFFIQAGNNILGVGIGISKKTIYISYIQIIVFASVVVASFLLIPKFGSLGASFVFLIGAHIQSFLYFFISERLFEVRYNFWKLFFFSIFIMSFSYCGMLYIDTISRLLTSTLIATVFSLLTLIFSLLMLNTVENGTVKKLKSLLQRVHQ